MYDARLNHRNLMPGVSKKVAGLVLPAVIGLAVIGLQSGAGAQSLTFLLFERYLEPLRVQAGIPGLSAVIVQDGQVVWEHVLGHRDIEASLPMLPTTPFPVADLTQTLTATLLLQCAERGELRLDDPIGKWVPQAADAGTTLRQLLLHYTPASARSFKYDPARFALLTTPIEACGEQPFRKIVAREILDYLAMADAVPGRDINQAPLEIRQLFDATVTERYAATLQRLATPYRVDKRRRATRGDLPPATLDGSNGLIASARDLAQFARGLDARLLLRAETLTASWANESVGGVTLPTGLGWFVQTYQGEQLVWHFGLAPDAFSSLILKVPGRRLTLILLANSDGLSAPFALSDGDVTSSLFARTFLRLFL